MQREKPSELFEGENSSLRRTYEEAVKPIAIYSKTNNKEIIMQRENSICGKTILKGGFGSTCLLPHNHIGGCKNSPFVIDEFGNKVQPVQRENKWQDRLEKGWKELISEKHYLDENSPPYFFYELIDTAIAEERKAFGGCTKCYGKGYATVRYGFNAHADFIGDKSYEYGTKTHMEFCECDRGEQLKKLLKK